MSDETSAEQTPEEQPDLLEQVEGRLDQDDEPGAADRLREERPEDVAEVLMGLPADEAAAVFRLLSLEMSAEVLGELNPEMVQDLAEAETGSVAGAAGLMQPDELTDVVESLETEQQRAMLGSLPAEAASVVRQLLAHESDTAGGIMTPEFVLLSEDITAARAVEITQSSRESETIAHLFVSDPQNRLLGHLPLHQLVFARPERRLRELYDPEVVTVTTDTDQEEVVRLATHYGLDVVPVVDDEGQMQGVITVDDILEVVREEADEDMYRLAGTTERDPVHATVMRSTRLRLPWLLITLVGGLCIAFLVSRFESTLEAVQIAFFIPLIPLMGGNVAIQASAIVVRGLAVGDIHSGRLLQFVMKQWMVTIMLAACCGLAAGVVGAFFPQMGARLPLVVGIAIATAIMLAGTLGTLLPLAFNHFGLDPAVSAGPFVTLLNDLLCITIYLSLGQLALS